MFGKLRDKEMSDEELDLVQKLHPQTFGGYPRTFLSHDATNPNMFKNPKQIGYEGIMTQAASALNPEDPLAFGQWYQQNLRKMDPYTLKRFFDYMQTLNKAADNMQINPTTKQKIHSGGM